MYCGAGLACSFYLYRPGFQDLRYHVDAHAVDARSCAETRVANWRPKDHLVWRMGRGMIVAIAIHELIREQFAETVLYAQVFGGDDLS